jgi:hypothetical protein
VEEAVIDPLRNGREFTIPPRCERSLVQYRSSTLGAEVALAASTTNNQPEMSLGKQGRLM